MATLVLEATWVGLVSFFCGYSLPWDCLLTRFDDMRRTYAPILEGV